MQFPEKVIPLFATRALDDQPLPLYASTQNRREWIHVLDHCRAIERVLDDGRVGETYHVGTGVERTIEEIADGVLDALGKPASLKTIVPDRPGHDRRYVLDASKIRDELGMEAPTIDFDDRAARDRAVVRRQSRVVGAAARARTGRRIRSLDVTERRRHRRGRAGRARRWLPRSSTRSGLDHAALDVTSLRRPSRR